MIEYRAGENQAIKEGNCDADWHALFHLPQHAARRRAVDVEVRIFAAVRCRNHERLAVNRESDVAEKALVENSINRLAIVNAAVRLADDTCPLGWHFIFSHGDGLRAGAKDG